MCLQHTSNYIAYYSVISIYNEKHRHSKPHDITVTVYETDVSEKIVQTDLYWPVYKIILINIGLIAILG